MITASYLAFSTDKSKVKMSKDINPTPVDSPSIEKQPNSFDTPDSIKTIKSSKISEEKSEIKQIPQIEAVASSSTCPSEPTNPILHSLCSSCPIFHELPLHPKLIQLVSSYISLSFVLAAYPHSASQSSLGQKFDNDSSIHILPLLGRPLTDVTTPDICHPFYLPADEDLIKKAQKLALSLEYIFGTYRKKTQLVESDMLYLLCILDRLLCHGPKRGLTIKIENATMIVTVCMMLVNKMSCDHYFLNSFWSELFLIPLKSLNKSESIILTALDYDLTFQWIGKRFFPDASDSSLSVHLTSHSASDDRNDPFDRFLVFLSHYTALWKL
ncbi:uncharacterized protein MONOS_16383 [Monocercomonoides exilis]|uniref:uncharacterized protein n=1 Tax=Monocercomonoides exilis TaxID=2049356 RepID=UPI00355A5496|nr:hypothetical protein MONOS_16383 [Monocercomonoides exilis]|eukprot:MONOS_16383.1-p1 / transcript=MONOS_16383.1 / gene=MONOS_16383 / organism=Monocercomonoides_exilis_PA203 / gene_product=unspecified product / transcript_product=unspecified product / location=Mono_scaffold01693:2736-3716(+) / protein_length=326 / sequence_SO=supercontig / SO=protein_coding / is_pseudo=false